MPTLPTRGRDIRSRARRRHPSGPRREELAGARVVGKDHAPVVAVLVPAVKKKKDTTGAQPEASNGMNGIYTVSRPVSASFGVHEQRECPRAPATRSNPCVTVVRVVRWFASPSPPTRGMSDAVFRFQAPGPDSFYERLVVPLVLVSVAR